MSLRVRLLPLNTVPSATNMLMVWDWECDVAVNAVYVIKGDSLSSTSEKWH